jgi:RimJ/RimL family protein N-acetyltransferase
VVLRPIERDDVPALTAMWQDLETAHRGSDNPPLPRSAEEEMARFERDAEEPPADGAWFAVVLNQEVIGNCGLGKIDHYHGRAELGITLRRELWGKGYGQDAMRVLLGYAFRTLNLHSVWLETLADDDRAVGAYRKVGFGESGRLRQHAWFDGAFRDALLMEILRDEWEPRS